MVSKDPIKSIIEALRLNPEGLTLLSLASITGLHRHTCTKYIHELTIANIVYQRDVGAAKLCYLKRKLESKEDAERLADRLNKKRRKSRNQLRMMAIVVILTFLLSETVIIAYENDSLLNMTNFSEINTSPMTSTTNISNLSTFFNGSMDENTTENVTVEPSSVPDMNLSVGTVENTNGSSNSQNNSENSTFNTTFLTENVTISNETVDNNATVNETNTSQIGTNQTNFTSNATQTDVSNETEVQNQTENNQTIEDILNGTSIEPIDPVFNVQLFYPERVNRGEVLTIRAEATSNAPAKGVHLRWMLPVGFEIVSGNAIETCGDMEAGSCVSEIGVRTISSQIGLNQIKVVVNYEKQY